MDTTESQSDVRRHVSEVVTDHNNVVYIVFYLLGITTLLPWNFFIAINSFWDYKFRHINATIIEPVEHGRTALQDDFISYLAIASNLPNALFVIITAAILGQCVSLRLRVYTTLSLAMAVFVVLIGFGIADSDKWQGTFLNMTLVCVVVANSATAVFQSSIFGLAGRFPARFMDAVMAGQAVGGILPSLIVLFFALSDTPPTIQGWLSFTIVLSFLITSCILFHWGSRRTFFKMFFSTAEVTVQSCGDSDDLTLINDTNLPQTDLNASGGRQMWTAKLLDKFDQLGRLLASSVSYQLGIFITFASTLAVFPAMTVLVQPVNKLQPWMERLYTPVTCFLLFNVGDFCGRRLGAHYPWILLDRSKFARLNQTASNNLPAEHHHVHHWRLPLVAILRALIFIPIFMFCNVDPSRRTQPVLIHSDFVYIAAMALFALSNGFLANICMSFGPKAGVYSPEESERVAMLLVAFLVIGTCSGSLISYPLLQIIL